LPTFAYADTLPLLENLSLNDVPLGPRSRHSFPLTELTKEDHQVESLPPHSTPKIMPSPITSVVEHFHANADQGKESEGVQKPCCQSTAPGVPVSCSGTVPLKRLLVDLTVSFDVSPQPSMSSSSSSSSSPLSNGGDSVVQSTSFPSHSRASTSQNTVRMKNTTGIQRKTKSDDAGNSRFGFNALQQQQQDSNRTTMQQLVSARTGLKGNRRIKVAHRLTDFSPNAISESGIPVKRSKRIAKQKENESQPLQK